MARLADRIWELRWVPPQMLCYRPELRSEERGGFSVGRMKAVMEDQRNKIADAPVYAADSVGQYFYKTATRDHDLTVADFPAVAIPEDSAFIEFRKPDLREVVGGGRIAGELPHWWGWHVVRHDPETFGGIFRSRHALHPSCAAGLLCILWLSPDDRSLFAPLAAMGLQVASDGELLAAPSMALAFENDPARVNDPNGLFGYFNVLFLPAVAAMAFMACKSTTIRRSDAEATLNRARVRKKRRPFVGYATIECEPIKDVLRHRGMAGIQGLAAAMRQCRGEFVQDMRGGPSAIILPGSR